MASEKIIINSPLVDENLNVLESADSFIKQTEDEFNTYDVIIEVSDLSMVPTAMFFSLRLRRNINFTVKLNDFPGANFIHSFLISGHIKEVTYG